MARRRSQQQQLIYLLQTRQGAAVYIGEWDTNIKYKTKLQYPLCLKKVSTFKLSVLSNLNQFSKFCTYGKHMKFATKPIHQYGFCEVLPHLRHVATLSMEIKN